MIPLGALQAWRRSRPWADQLQVEQDAILSRLAIEIAGHPHLGSELAWRGGTCLHKLHLPSARRYSEDLDYVLVTEARRFARIAADLTQVLETTGLSVDRREVTSTRITLRGIVPATAPPAGAELSPVAVKVEVNTSDPIGHMPLTRIAHAARIGRWWSGSAQILTFEAPALIGSKFRALAQRRKGRDLSDIWLARRELPIGDDALAEAAWWYTFQREGITPRELAVRLRSALADPSFVNDLDALTLTPYAGFSALDYGRELIRWIDRNLEPRYAATRAASALRREQQAWARDGWRPGAERCVDLADGPGTPARCRHWLVAGGDCPAHGSQP